MNEAWSNRAHEIIDGSKDAIQILVNSMDKRAVSTPNSPDLPADTSVQTCFAYFANDFDDDNGGFGTRPKFPQPGKYSFRKISLSLSMDCFLS